MINQGPPAAVSNETTTGTSIRFGGRNVGFATSQNAPARRTDRIPDARLTLLARRLHALDPRPLFEFLREMAAGCDLVERLEAYAKLNPDIVRALGGDQIPGPHVLDGGAT